MPEGTNAEEIAKVVADLRAGRVRGHRDLMGTAQGRERAEIARRVIRDPVVIDATTIRRSIPDQVDVHLYEDHPQVAPPFPETAIAFVNDYGNVPVVHVTALDMTGGTSHLTDNALSVLDANTRWDTHAPIDWDRVRWRLACHLYLGGRNGDGQEFETTGPLYLWRIAVYDDGEPADIAWEDLSPTYTATGRDWDTEMLTLLRTLSFLNCRNVDVAEPARPRAERRRVERAGGGVKVQTIHVYPPGPRRPHVKGTPLGEGTGEFSPTRGHFAHYGERYGRGLLFGKYEGKFWHAPRVRVGERPDVDYQVHAQAGDDA